MLKRIFQRLGGFAGAVAVATTFALAGTAAFVPAVSAQGKAGMLPDFTELYEKNGPAVVSIDVTQKAKRGRSLPELSEDDPFYEFFRRFGQVPPGPARAATRAGCAVGRIRLHHRRRWLRHHQCRTWWTAPTKSPSI